MTNIFCSSPCIYQKEGNCSYSLVSVSKFEADNECIYFIEKK